MKYYNINEIPYNLRVLERSNVTSFSYQFLFIPKEVLHMNPRQNRPSQVQTLT